MTAPDVDHTDARLHELARYMDVFTRVSDQALTPAETRDHLASLV